MLSQQNLDKRIQRVIGLSIRAGTGPKLSTDEVQMCQMGTGLAR